MTKKKKYSTQDKLRFSMYDELTDEELEEHTELIKDAYAKRLERLYRRPGSSNISTIGLRGVRIMKLFTYDEMREIRLVKESVPEFLLLSKDMDIQDILKRISQDGFPELRTNGILAMKFWTEEEIIKYPGLFKLDTFSTVPILFYSEETLKLLNKVHGRKFRYPKKKMHLLQILLNRDKNRLPTTLEDLMYLAEKLNTDNQELIRVFSSYSVKTLIGNFNEDFDIMYKVMKG